MANLLINLLPSKGTRLLALLLIAFSISSQAQQIQLTFSQGVKANMPETFRPLSPSDLSTHMSFWLKATITADDNQTKVLKAGNWYMQHVSCFNESGRMMFTGNYGHVQLRKGENIFYLFYPFVDDKDKNGVTVSLIDPLAFNEENLAMRTGQYVFTAIIGLLLLLSAFYSFIIRSSDKIYTHYAFYLFTIFVFFSYQYGILGDTISVVRQIPPAWFWIFSDFITITYVFFAQSFLNMKETDPLLFRVFNFGKYLVGSMVVIETISYLLQVDLLHSLWFKSPIFVFEFLVFFFIFYRVYRMKTTLSWLFLISTIVLGAANLAGQIASTYKAVLPTNVFIQSGTIIDAFLFFIGIGIRFGISNKEKQQIQNDLINQLQINEKIQEKNATELEMKVKERTEALNKRNHENELLIKEIHHRVKNNLQVVASLLNISERKISDEVAKQPFRDSANRINSMGLIHSFLYQNDNFSNIDLKKYISQLTSMLVDSFHNKYPDTRIDLDVGLVNLDMDSAIEIGLIINELVTNSLKHGVYADSKPIIQLSLQQEGSKLYLRVGDNGLLNGQQKINVEASFGMRMITALAKKLNGTVSIRQISGFEVTIVFENSGREVAK